MRMDGGGLRGPQRLDSRTQSASPRLEEVAADARLFLEGRRRSTMRGREGRQVGIACVVRNFQKLGECDGVIGGDKTLFVRVHAF